MARIHPEGWRQIRAAGTVARKLETLAVLTENLPDGYTVYHDIHWTRIQNDRSLFGGIDFVVVGPAGSLLLIEQKSGFLDETSQGLMQTYARGRRNVTVELAQTVEHLRARLGAFFDGYQPRMEGLLYCPDYRVKQSGSAGIVPLNASSMRRAGSSCPRLSAACSIMIRRIRLCSTALTVFSSMRWNWYRR